MDIKQSIDIKLQQLQASNLPSSVLQSIETEVKSWEIELNEAAQRQMASRIDKRITKPFIARHFSGVFKRRKVNTGAQGGI